jgi:membrane peptidoglycan carboxypeptidase
VTTPASPILKVVDGEGRTIYEHKPDPKLVLDPRAAWLITNVLSDNNARLVTFGANSTLRLAGGRPAAAKTGSTDDYRDSWTMGYTPSLVAGVWVGRNDHKPMKLVVGSSGAGKIWNAFMEGALEGQPIEAFPAPPPGVVQATVCATTGFAGTADCPRMVTDWFMKEHLPTIRRPAVAIDRVNGKLAGPNTPYQDIVFQGMNQRVSGEGPFPPTEYSERTGGGWPWDGVIVLSVPTALPSQQNRAASASPVPQNRPTAAVATVPPAAGQRSG